MGLRVARFWETFGDSIKCLVCERMCKIARGGRGICGNYVNVNGTLYHLGYGRISAIESRPIEIKPLFHYWPNSTALTFSNWGCNFYCPWCQNYHLSFRKPSGNEDIVEVEELLKLAAISGDEGFSASFNEPTTNVDYILDLAREAVKRGFYVMMVTNGYLTVNALKALVEAGVDGWSIDIKGCPGMKRALASIDHSVVYRNARMILDMGGHVEMVYLVVTNTNDFEECIDWIIGTHLDKLGSSVPLHINRYYPANHWREQATSLSKLLQIYEKARREGLEYIYVGNIGSVELESTKCPRCGKKLIIRRYYRVTDFLLEKAGNEWRCPQCNYKIPVKGMYVPGKGIPL